MPGSSGFPFLMIQPVQEEKLKLFFTTLDHQNMQKSIAQHQKIEINWIKKSHSSTLLPSTTTKQVHLSTHTKGS
nr:hypothetical protein CFP56_34598 [Quercus suber]